MAGANQQAADGELASEPPLREEDAAFLLWLRKSSELLVRHVGAGLKPAPATPPRFLDSLARTKILIL